MEMSKCCTCGYEWTTGMSGSHSCAAVLVKTVKEQAQRIEALEKDLIRKKEKELLTRIAYCAEGMFDSKRANNLGDAAEWERHLQNATDEYYEHLFSSDKDKSKGLAPAEEDLQMMDVPILKGTFPVVLYLGSEDDREELIQAIKEIYPNMRSRKLPNFKT